mgnify:FL=1
MIDSEKNAQGDATSQASQDAKRLRRLAQAIDADEQADATICRQVQQILPRMAEAELRGQRIGRIFPVETAHMDGCEDCAMAYAELLDALIGLEEAIGQEPLSQPPALPARLTMAMRLRGWVLKLSQEMAAALKLADPANFEAAAQALMERLPELPQLLTPRQAEQLALGWGSEADSARLLLACWDTTEQIVSGHTARQLDDMVRAGRLADVARASAKDTAKRLKLGKQGARFVDLYAAQVQADPAALAALARAHD